MASSSPSLMRRRLPDFNGAMAVRPWMVVLRDLLVSVVHELQWGHGREAMDGGVVYWNQASQYTSMGPWP